MSNETLFYICGIVLAVSAVTVSMIGLKVPSFPGKAMPVVVLWFGIFAAGAGTFAVLHGKDEDKAKAAVYKEAGKKAEEESQDTLRSESGAPESEEEEKEGEGFEEVGGEGEESEGGEKGTKEAEEAEGGAAAGASSTLKLEAAQTELAFNTTELEAEAGKVTIDLKNPSSIAHNIAIEKEGKVVAESETLAEGETSATAELEPGTYTFLCTVPGHAEAGMEGMLVVK